MRIDLGAMAAEEQVPARAHHSDSSLGVEHTPEPLDAMAGKHAICRRRGHHGRCHITVVTYLLVCTGGGWPAVRRSVGQSVGRARLCLPAVAGRRSVGVARWGRGSVHGSRAV